MAKKRTARMQTPRVRASASTAKMAVQSVKKAAEGTKRASYAGIKRTSRSAHAATKKLAPRARQYAG